MMPIAQRVLVPAAALAALTFPRPAQDPAQDPAETLELAADQEHSLAELVDEVARFTGRTYLRKEMEFAQTAPRTFSVQNRLQLDRDAARVFLVNMLFTHGFAAVPLDPEQDVYELIQTAGPRRSTIWQRAQHMSPEQVLARRNEQVMVTCTVSTQRVNANTAQTQLRPFLAQAGSAQGNVIAGSVGDGGTLILTGYAPQVASALDIVAAAESDSSQYLGTYGERISKLEKLVAQLAAKKD